MSLVIGNYEFAGPYQALDELSNTSGIHIALKKGRSDYEILTYGFTQLMKDTCRGLFAADPQLLVAVFYVEKSDGEKIARVLQDIEIEYGSPTHA